MNIQDYVKPELLVLIPVLYLIGMGLKKSALADKWIPALLGAAGIVLAGLYVLATTPLADAQETAMAAFTAVTQGVLAAGASVYVNQIIVQGGKDE